MQIFMYFFELHIYLLLHIEKMYGISVPFETPYNPKPSTKIRKYKWKLNNITKLGEF